MTGFQDPVLLFHPPAEDVLRAAFGHDGPALVDVRTVRHELALPPKLTFGQIKGFTRTRPGRSCPVAGKN